jgi:hypothetical protein
MLVLASIFLASGCLFIAVYALLAYRCRQQLALVRARVKEEVDAKTRAANALDAALGRRLADGKATTEAIDEWQTARAEVLPAGQPSRPWAFGAKELQDWAREQVEDAPRPSAVARWCR